jgi:hypothetical protein
MHYGENYWFNGCAKYVMECLGEKEYDYSFFAGLTGDNLRRFTHTAVSAATGQRLFPERPGKFRFIEDVFAACGYASTFAP